MAEDARGGASHRGQAPQSTPVHRRDLPGGRSPAGSSPTSPPALAAHAGAVHHGLYAQRHRPSGPARSRRPPARQAVYPAGPGAQGARACSTAPEHEACPHRSAAATQLSGRKKGSPIVQFTLPKNSKVKKGKAWNPPPEGAQVGRWREYRIYRYDPDTTDNPRLDTYWVDMEECEPMVLDALIWIKNKVDPTLTFRRSCREGVCGSCSMNIAGTNTLACTMHAGDAKGAIAVYPLPHMPVIKDLVPDMTQFYAQLRGHRTVAQDRHAPRRKRNGARAMTSAPSSTGCTNASCAPAARPPARLIGGTASAISARRSCSRPTARWRNSNATSGPANGSTISRTRSRLYRSHTILNCTKACPKGLNPAARPSPRSSASWSSAPNRIYPALLQPVVWRTRESRASPSSTWEVQQPHPEALAAILFLFLELVRTP